MAEVYYPFAQEGRNGLIPHNRVWKYAREDLEADELLVLLALADFCNRAGDVAEAIGSVAIRAHVDQDKIEGILQSLCQKGEITKKYSLHPTYTQGQAEYLDAPAGRDRRAQQKVKRIILNVRGNKCQECDYPGYVELHHIIEVQNGGTYDPDNLLLLCEKCHAEAHGHEKKNYKDKQREHWNEELE